MVRSGPGSIRFEDMAFSPDMLASIYAECKDNYGGKEKTAQPAAGLQIPGVLQVTFLPAGEQRGHNRIHRAVPLNGIG
jgi:hypothetical protein